MKLIPHRPLTYLITDGLLTPDARPGDSGFNAFLRRVEAATRARISLIQIREKNLTAHALYCLAEACARITRNTNTRLLVNDRADIARASGADGVHLTTVSIPARIVRETFGENFLIGVSAHNFDEAKNAHAAKADFATFSPIYVTPSKSHLNLPPIGVASLRYAAQTLAPFPLIALGGVSLERTGEVLRAGATGVAGIRLFDEDENFGEIERRLDEQQ